MIWQRKKTQAAVFVHIPKTAGGSIRVFCKKAGVRIVGHDLRSPDYRWFHEQPALRELFSFTIVRHPVDRCLSAFQFLSQGGINDGDRADAERFVLPYDGDFEAFVRTELPKGDVLQQIHFIPQHRWVGEGERLLVDAVFRFEDMAAVERKLQTLFHTPFHFPVRNASRKQAVELESIRPLIEEIYRTDMERFQYGI